MSLRDEIQELMRQPVDEEPAVLQSFMEGRPIPISLETGMKIFAANMEGMRAAVLRLADEIEALQDSA
jgi:hypothetical protein